MIAPANQPESERPDGDGRGGNGGPITHLLEPGAGFGGGRPAAHLRRNARDIVKLLQHQLDTGETVFTEQEVIAALRAAGKFTIDAVRANDVRRYVPVFRLWLKTVEVAQKERLALSDADVQQIHGHLHLHGNESMAERITKIMAKIEGGEAAEGDGNGRADG